MSLYRVRGDPLEATQWFKNGDHPKDDVWRVFEDTGKKPTAPREGAIVRYFRSPAVSGDSICSKCGLMMHVHGYLDYGSCGVIVHPGDYIVTDGDSYVVRDRM